MRLAIDLTEDEFTRLLDMAETERRPTRLQAAVLVARGLETMHVGLPRPEQEYPEKSRLGLPAA